MSVLLVGAGGALADALIARLVGEGDEVRVVEDDDRGAARWRALGAFVARGTPDDFDLVERAAQSARTIVVLSPEIPLAPVLQGATAARVDRIVVCGAGARSAAGPLEEAALDHVVLDVPQGSAWRRRRAVAPAALAEAIDAADDLAGSPRLVLDLGHADAWRALGLTPPDSL